MVVSLEAQSAPAIAGLMSPLDVICLSHLRWNFVHQRPQHLLTRCGAERRVFYIEEPVLGGAEARLDRRDVGSGVTVCEPHLPEGTDEAVANLLQRRLIDLLIETERIDRYLLWYYTPMALEFTRDLEPEVTVFDCMDDLAGFAFAPKRLREREAELLDRADVVFTGGRSLYEARRGLHANLHLFPSSVDVEHFSTARLSAAEPEDQERIPSPRIGFYGVIDERLDLALLEAIAAARPDWQFVLLGPVLKLDAADLPRAENIHWLGAKDYDLLPRYLAGWDVAMMPFARNRSTRFISPTKTLEYVAGGKPVVSTSIRDVVHPYGEEGIVRIAEDVPGWISAIERAMDEDAGERDRRAAEALDRTSWDRTWGAMRAEIARAVGRRADGGAA
jgi:glycosyltransferase involved in cell wall biosynthesis